MCVHLVTALTLQFKEVFHGVLRYAAVRCGLVVVVVVEGSHAWRLTRGHHPDQCGLGL